MWTVRRAVVGMALGAALSMGCSATGPSEIEVGTEFLLAPNQTVRISGTDLTIGFRRVVGDSRCPVDLLCVVEGSAGVELDVFGAAQAGPIVLESAAGLDRWSDGAYVIQLLGLQPSPTAERQIPQDEYRVRLIVLPDDGG
ncbi:MAG: hypothetical protein R2909_18760 [Gemmatimonadales bacterium]